MPFWSEIDGIWKNHLHVFLHSAGCFLNTKYLESSSFDPNIMEDMKHCMVHMGGDTCSQDLIKLQIEKYQAAQKLQIELQRKRQQTSGESTSYPQCIYLQVFVITLCGMILFSI